MVLITAHPLPFLLFSIIFGSAHGTISVISEDTNETVRVIYEKNIRAVSDAVEGYIVISNPLNACEAVDPAPVRRNTIQNGNGSTEASAYSYEDDGRVDRDWVLLSIVYDCDVTTKARNAQLGGYKALIIQNIGSNDSQHIPWHILRFPLVKLNHVLVGEYDGDLLRFNFSYPHNRFYVRFEEDKFYQLMCYILIGIIIVLLSTMFALFWFQICCAIIIVVPHQLRMMIQRWLHPGKRRLTRPMLQLIPVKNWSRTDPFQACAICQEDFKENDKIRVLPCLHGFHSVCVDPWLLRRSRRCPCCMQRVRLPNDVENDEDEEEETYATSQRRNRDGSRSSIDQGNGNGCRGASEAPTDGVDDPLLIEQSPQAMLHSPLTNPKSNTSEGCTITSPSESRKSSQDVKTLDWQLRRFLQNFHYNPSASSDGGAPSDLSSVRCHTSHGKNSEGMIPPSCNVHSPYDTPRHKYAPRSCHNTRSKLHGKSSQKALTTNIITTGTEQNPATASHENEHNLTKTNPSGSALKLLETCLDNSQSSGSSDVQNSTLEVQVGTTEDASYHLSSPYPLSSNNTFTLSTTRGRKTSDATTISGSLPRDESSFQNAEEIVSTVDVFPEAPNDKKSLQSEQQQSPKNMTESIAVADKEGPAAAEL